MIRVISGSGSSAPSGFSPPTRYKWILLHAVAYIVASSTSGTRSLVIQKIPGSQGSAGGSTVSFYLGAYASSTTLTSGQILASGGSPAAAGFGGSTTGSAQQWGSQDVVSMFDSIVISAALVTGDALYWYIEVDEVPS